MSRLLAAFLICLITLSIPARADDPRGLVRRDGPPPGTEQRIALVIGNGAYATAPLRNPVNDARAVAAKLRGLGFAVAHLENANRRTMTEAIRSFGTELGRGGGVGLFFFAGHGMQVAGRNYLLPVDVDITEENEVPFEAVDTGRILAKMESAGNRLNIVILDACRNNPFARSFRSAAAGLAQMDAPSGTVIEFATAPGSVASDGSDGSNSIYTRHLLDVLDRPGLKLEEVFKTVRSAVVADSDGKQVPWENSSLLGDFYFNPPAETAAEPAPPPVAAAPPAAVAAASDTGADLAFWNSIKDSGSPAYFEAYLKQFPNGSFAALARLKVDELTKQPAAAPAPASLVRNGGFESDFKYFNSGQYEPRAEIFWGAAKATAKIDDKVAHSGRNSLRIENRSKAAPQIYRTMCQRIDGLTPRRNYRIAFWVKGENLDPHTVEIVTNPSWTKRIFIPKGSYDWTRVEGTANTEDRDYLDLRLLSETVGKVWIDDIVVTEATD